MKFAQYLDRNAVEEWRKAYLAYRPMKKLIKRVAKHHRQRLVALAESYGAAEVGSASSAKDVEEESFTSLRNRVRAAQAGTGNYGSTGSSADLSAQPPRPRGPEPISLDGTGLKLSSSAEAKLRAGKGVTHSTQVDGADLTSHQYPTRDGDVEQHAESTAVAAIRAGPSNVDMVSMPSSSSEIKSKKKKSEKGRGSDKSKKRKRRTDADFDEYVNSIFDPSERIFFLLLDSELERITDFYERELTEAQTKFQGLVGQLRELAEHRRKYKAAHLGEISERLAWAPATWRHSHPKASQPRASTNSTLRQRTDGRSDFDRREEDAGGKRRSLALQHMQELTEGGVASGGPGTPSGAYDPVRYKAARHKLKDAMAEFYRGLELLRSFQTLNRDGFGKALKKFDKMLQTEASQKYWQAKVESSVLVRSQRIDALLRSTEDAFAGFFEHGDRKKALDRLRLQGQVQNTLHTHHGSASRTGFFLGIAFCAVIGGLVEAMKPEKQAQIPLWQGLLRVYGALFLPVFFALLFGINLAVFARSRISTIFIFEWDSRTALDYHQYFEMPALLLLLLSVAFWVSFVNPFPSSIAPTTWPLVWLVVTIVIMAIPLPVLHLRSRYWFIKSIGRVFGAGFLTAGTVEFRDFFLGDELNSIAWSLSNLWYIGCEYQNGWEPPQCSPNDTYWTAALISLPALLRLGQCLRRYADSQFYARVHLLNAAKYSTTVFQAFLYIHWRKGGSHIDGDLAVWVFFASIYSSFSMAWDVLMDWSLLHPNARYPLLRNDLVFESVWPVYYFAIVSNIILRCSWIIYLLPGSASLLTRTFLVALLEVLRRFQWGFFRIANEHQANVDQYRALRDTPLPYYVPKVEEEGEEQLGKEKIPLGARLRTWTRAGIDRDHEASANARSEAAVDAAASSAAAAAATTEESRASNDVAAVGTIGASSATASIPEAGGTAPRRPHGMILKRMQTYLVPDRGGWSARGHRLDDESAAKGAMGRDYAPRAQEADAISDDEDEEEDSDDGEGEGDGGTYGSGSGSGMAGGDQGDVERGDATLSTPAAHHRRGNVMHHFGAATSPSRNAEGNVGGSSASEDDGGRKGR